MSTGKVANCVATVSGAIGRAVSREGFDPTPEIICADRFLRRFRRENEWKTDVVDMSYRRGAPTGMRRSAAVVLMALVVASAGCAPSPELEEAAPGVSTVDRVDFGPQERHPPVGSRVTGLLPCIYSARATPEQPTPEPEPYAGCARRAADGELAFAAAHVARMDFGDDGLTAVLVDGDWHYVDPSGRSLRVLTYDNGADRFAGGLVRGLRDGKMIWFDSRFEVVVPPRYDWGWPFENGRALVCLGCVPGEPDGEHRPIVGGRWGFIDAAGREVVPLELSRHEALELLSGPAPVQDCAEELRALVDWPLEAVGDSREEAIGRLALGPPRSVSVEVGESRHARGDGFLPLVRYRLRWRQVDLVFVQPATGGRELLEQAVWREQASPLNPPIPFGSAPRLVEARLGQPRERTERWLRFECPNELGADEVVFSYRQGRLEEVHWRFFID